MNSNHLDLRRIIRPGHTINLENAASNAPPGADMRNMTITIEDQTYREIRAWCAHRDTCPSHVVRAFLKDVLRMNDIHRFPLPIAPDPKSLGSRFNDLYAAEVEAIQRAITEMSE
jgi:hypothetical protein